MVDVFTAEQRSYVMRQVKSKDTGPELIVRRLAHKLGYRFRLHRKELAGKPDLAFISMKKVIFVHGCFWHGHGCKRSTLPVTRKEYWARKIQRTMERDRKNYEILVAQGWNVLELWECKLTDRAALERSLLEFLSN